MDKRNWIILVLSIACGVLLWLQWDRKVEVGGADFIKQREDSLISENKRIMDLYVSRELENEILKKNNDSLQTKERSVQTNTVYINEKINHLSANGLVNEFNRLFANANIK